MLDPLTTVDITTTPQSSPPPETQPPLQTEQVKSPNSRYSPELRELMEETTQLLQNRAACSKPLPPPLPEASEKSPPATKVDTSTANQPPQEPGDNMITASDPKNMEEVTAPSSPTASSGTSSACSLPSDSECYEDQLHFEAVMANKKTAKKEAKRAAKEAVKDKPPQSTPEPIAGCSTVSDPSQETDPLPTTQDITPPPDTPCNESPFDGALHARKSKETPGKRKAETPPTTASKSKSKAKKVKKSASASNVRLDEKRLDEKHLIILSGDSHMGRAGAALEHAIQSNTHAYATKEKYATMNLGVGGATEDQWFNGGKDVHKDSPQHKRSPLVGYGISRSAIELIKSAARRQNHAFGTLVICACTNNFLPRHNLPRSQIEELVSTYLKHISILRENFPFYKIKIALLLARRPEGAAKKAQDIVAKEELFNNALTTQLKSLQMSEVTVHEWFISRWATNGLEEIHLCDDDYLRSLNSFLFTTSE